MQLVEQRILDLDADIGEYLDFSIPRRFHLPITLRHLLTHTAGFESNHFGYMAAWSPEEAQPLGRAVKEHVPSQIWAPGQVAAYSNWGAALAGHIVGVVSGEGFDGYVENHIFEPLGMRGSTFREPIPTKMGPTPIGYVFDGLQLIEHPFEYYSSVSPAGSLTTTAYDMTRFMSAHLTRGASCGGQVLSERMAEAMHTRVPGFHPCLDGATLGFYETYRNGRRTIGHKGATVCFESRLTLVPDEGLGIFVASNTGPGNGFCDAIVDAVLDAAFPAQLPTMFPPIDFASRASRYVGAYAFSARSHTKMEKVLSSIHTAEIRALSDRLVIRGLSQEPKTEWMEVRGLRGVFRRVDAEQMIAFEPLEQRKGYRLLGLDPFNPLESVEIVGTSWLCECVLQMAPLAFLLTGAGAFLSWSSLSPLMSWLAVALALTNMLVVAGISRTLACDQYTLLVKLPWELFAARLLAAVSVPMTAVITIGALMCWMAQPLPIAGAASALALLALGFTYWLEHWKLIEFWHGITDTAVDGQDFFNFPSRLHVACSLA